MTSTEALADKLGEVDARQKAGLETTPKTRTLVDQLNTMGPELKRAFPKTVDVQRYIRLAITELRTVPHLLECTAPSVQAGLMQAAQLGVEVGGLRQQAFLIPRKIQGTWEASFQLGYRGLIDIAGRNGVTVRVRDVCELDDFEYDDGVPPLLRHKPHLRGDRGPAYAYFAIASWPDAREPEILVMGRAEIERHRDRFAATRKNGKVTFGPWHDHFDAMARKTIVLRILNYLSLPVEVAEAIASTEADCVDSVGDPELPPPASADVPSGPRDGASELPDSAEGQDAPNTHEEEPPPPED